MNEEVFESERAFGSSNHIGVIVCVTPHGNLHAGILYANENDERSVLHLGWEDNISNEWPWDGLWITPRDVEPERLETIGALCEKIFNNYRRQTFPYALDFRGSYFSEDGYLIVADGARGLTCATLVLAIFKSFGIDIIEEPNWAVRKDEDFRFLLSVSRFANRDHWLKLREEVEKGVKRIHPHELLAACTCSRMPARFDDTRDPALRILGKFLDHAIPQR